MANRIKEKELKTAWPVISTVPIWKPPTEGSKRLKHLTGKL